MNNKYEKQDNHITDKWGNIIPKDNIKKPIFENKKPPINNPFKEIFGDIFTGFKEKK